MDPHNSTMASAISGLTTAEAAERRRRDGPNELPGQGPRSLIRVARDVIVEPMFLLLVAASAIYIALGDLREAAILAASLLVVIGITIVQERRTDRALSKLRDLSSPRALVIRDGVEQRIAGRDVVVGDLILLREGDRVPADAAVIEATMLAVDESILTGESLPVEKAAAAHEEPREHTRVYSSSLIVQGFGTARVTAIGVRTEVGKIGRILTTLAAEPTGLFIEVRRLVRWVAVAGLLLCAAIAVLYGATRGDWLAGVLAGITVAMSVLPEEFPLVLTVFLAMGAWRISQAHVLTRRMPALESIGAATVLAVDKTGTLTENRMQVVALETPNHRIDVAPGASLDRDSEHVLGTALAASERQPFDPMERGIHATAQMVIPATVQRLQKMTLLREYDLTPELLAVTHVWQSPGELQSMVAVKGAPETVMSLCRLDPITRSDLMERVNANARQGLRILGVAAGNIANVHELPANPHGFELRFLGLICLADPLRADVPAALAECKQAGIRVVMITGDYPGTALAIASQAGFDTSAGILTGAELEALDDEDLRRRVREVNVYARSKPEHKLRLVQAFKADGHEVVMTGDGVNDAPALKAAHVGVAMGGRGTDVAREAASLVLVNDDFGALVAAVRLGRRIYTNIRHAMSYIVSVHIPIAGMGLLPVLFGWPLLLFPVHVLFLEFVIDPSCAFVFEADPESRDVMRRPPRSRNTPLFSGPMLRRSIGLGVCVLVVAVSIYGLALRHLDDSNARALVFVSLVFANLALIFVSRSRDGSIRRVASRHNNIYWGVATLASLALAAAIYLPGIATIFAFSPPAWQALVAVAAGTVVVVLFAGRWLKYRP